MMVQYTPEWWEIRRGIPTASAFDKILTPKTCKPSASQEKYIAQLVAEVADLRPNWFTDRPMNPAQRHGLETEPEARRFYEMERAEVQQVGFCLNDCGRCGASPDGLVGDDGLLELKCVELATQAGYVMDPDTLLDDYRCQTHGQLIVTGRKWVDLLSYAPGLDPVMVRVEPNDFTALLAAELLKFLGKYADTLARLRMVDRYEAVRREAVPPPAAAQQHAAI